LDSTGAEAGHLPPAFDYDNCGSPRWSHDGSKIVYDAWHSWDGGSSNMSHVILVNSDGTSLKDLGRGALPSISPDGKRITYSQYDNNHGVWVMNIDGTAPKLLETIAWCSDWVSNDEVIYSTYGEDGINFRVENLTTGESRLLLSKTRYRQIYWGFGTSPDGKWVAFKGDLADGSGEELAVVNTEGKGKGFKVLLPGNTAKDVNYFDHYVNWTPDGKRLVALLSTKTRPNQQMYYLDLEGDNPPEWLSGQIPLRQFYCSTFSPDGKRLATMGRVIKPAIKNEKAEEAAP
jgi:Tol biopolymer transport system component